MTTLGEARQAKLRATGATTTEPPPLDYGHVGGTQWLATPNGQDFVEAGVPLHRRMMMSVQIYAPIWALAIVERTCVSQVFDRDDRIQLLRHGAEHPEWALAWDTVYQQTDIFDWEPTTRFLKDTLERISLDP